MGQKEGSHQKEVDRLNTFLKYFAVRHTDTHTERHIDTRDVNKACPARLGRGLIISKETTIVRNSVLHIHGKNAVSIEYFSP